MKCLDKMFVLCGTPSYIHSDRGSSFLSQEIKDYFSQRGIATSKTSPYHPIGNGQCERYNGITWKGVRMAPRTQNLSDTQWEIVLPNVLHSIRSLLSTATNTTPHERFFGFQRRSPCGSSLPTWLSAPGNVMLRRFVRNSKNDPLVDEVELTSVNPAYAHIRYPDGRESTVSLKDLSPCPSPEYNLPSPSSVNIPSDSQRVDYTRLSSPPTDTDQTPLTDLPSHVTEQLLLRRSSRISKQPERLNL